MATTFLESGSDATQDFVFFSSTSGTVASDSTTSVTGPRSIKLSTGVGPTTAFALSRAATNSVAGNRVSFWVKFDVLPAAAAQICYILTLAGSAVFSISVNTAGRLTTSPAGVAGVNGVTVLQINTWYRVSFAYTLTSATVYRIDTYLNGKFESTISDTGTMTQTAIDRFRINVQSTWGANANVWFDDIYIDDGSDYSDPGDMRVVAKRPFSNGTLNEFTTQIGVGGSGYGSGHAPQVNEQPLSTTNGWSISTTTKKTEQYSIENLATGDFDLNGRAIVDMMGWIYANVDSTANSPVHNIILKGVASAKILTTSYNLYNAFAGSTIYPAGNTDIGMDAQYTTTPHLTRLAECGVLIVFRNSSNTYLPLLGAG